MGFKVPGRGASTSLIFALSLFLLLPSFGIGFHLDDYLFLSAMDGNLHGRTEEDSLYALLHGEPGDTEELARGGYLPWWVQEDVKFVFFRPLSDVLLRVDHSLFGHRPFGWHLHSLLWWVATLFAVAALLRRSLPGMFGTMALLLFALDESHALPAAWISNRNALVALAPAFLGVWAHVRWRETGWWPGRLLSPAAFAVGLLGGEVALGAFGYVAVYEAVHPRPWQERMSGVGPFTVLAVSYLLFHRLAGYGTAGSGIYLDPTGDPAAFLAEAPARLLALASGAIVGFQADAWLFGPSWRLAQTVLGCLAVAIVALMFRACARRIDRQTLRALTWLVGGAAIALIPSLATFPSDRLLLASAPGFAALIGTTLVLGFRSLRRRGSKGLAAGALALAVVHLLLAPSVILLTQALLAVQSRTVLALARSDTFSELRGKQFVLPAAPDYVLGAYLPLVIDHVAPRELEGWRVLSLASADHRITRMDSRTLEIEVLGGTMMQTLFERLYRSEPLPEGAILDRGLMTVEVLDATEGSPTRVSFRFDRELEHESLVFLRWTGSSVERMEPPAITGTRHLQRFPGPAGF